MLNSSTGAGQADGAPARLPGPPRLADCITTYDPARHSKLIGQRRFLLHPVCYSSVARSPAGMGARHRHIRRLAVAGDAEPRRCKPARRPADRERSSLPPRRPERPPIRKGTPCNRCQRVICRGCPFRGPSRPVHGPGSVIIATLRNKPLACNVSEPPATWRHDRRRTGLRSAHRRPSAMSRRPVGAA